MVQGAYSHSLAEWALTACSWFAKDLPRLKQQQKDRNWEPYFVEELRQAIQLCQALLLLSLFANEGCLIRLHLTGRQCLNVRITVSCSTTAVIARRDSSVHAIKTWLHALALPCNFTPSSQVC